MSTGTHDPKTSAGVAYAAAAYLVWGLFPAYWKQLAGVSSLVVIAHRAIWSFLFVAAMLTVARRWGEVRAVLRRPRSMGALAVTTSLISFNWLLFIWAVNHGQVTQGSLGYYVNPLVNVLFARLFLGERLRPAQLLAVALAASGVAVLAIGQGTFPWIALSLAVSFSLYGLVRKQAPVEPLVGLAVETGIATPVAIGWLALFASGGGAAFGATGRELFFLLGSGAATALPLLWFATGAKRLRYTTMGILQYIAPTGQLALAVLAYGEPFTRSHAITFALIWTAVAIYAADGLLSRGRPAPATRPALRA